MKNYITASLALLLSLTACDKEKDLELNTYKINATWQSGKPRTSAKVGISMGSVGQSLCTQNPVNVKVSGAIGVNSYTAYTYSTDARDVSQMYLPCSNFLITAHELIPSPTGGKPTLGQEILMSFDSQCELRVKPGTYKSIRIQGRTNWIGTDPAQIGEFIDENKALQSLDIDC